MKKNLLEKIFINPWYGGLVLFTFASIGCFFSINSYFADKNDINWLFVSMGIVFGIAAIFCLAKANSTSTGKGG